MSYPHTGKAHFRVNLKTSDLVEAQKRRLIHGVAFEQEIRSAKKRQQGVKEEELLSDALAYRRWVEEAESEEDWQSRETLMQELALEKAEAMEAAVGEALAAKYYQTATGTRKGLEIATKLEAFIAEHPAKPHTNYKRRKVIESLGRWRAELYVESITRDLAREFVDEVIAPGRKPETINGDLGVLSTYWSWLTDRGLVPDSTQNHWTRFRRKKSRKRLEDKQRPYDDEEMKKLFLADKPMRADVLEFATISALSGARLEEIGTLRVCDIKTADMTIFLPGTKTEAAPRTIPLHPALAPLFNRHTEGKNADEWVFDDLPVRSADALKGRAAKISQAFTRFRRSVGVGYSALDSERSPVDFHSFRRWFASQMKVHGTPADLIDGICGWARGGMQDRYTWSADVLARMRTAVEQVRLPEGVAEKLAERREGAVDGSEN